MNNFLIKYFSFMVSEYSHEFRWLSVRVRIDSHLAPWESSYFLLNGHHVNLLDNILDLFIRQPF
jgi:hypothetical protein